MPRRQNKTSGLVRLVMTQIAGTVTSAAKFYPTNQLPCVYGILTDELTG